ncbi:hypothetical protein OK074_7381 [Actinobacteria bacterium OK074]|nr:hypothetical protein OK074_7381 [Actinobacteria bacterium OK074]
MLVKLEEALGGELGVFLLAREEQQALPLSRT